MKRFFEYLGLTAIILFSFYYTEKAALLVQSKNPIMTSIKEVEEDYETAFVNAEINGNTIVPGINGLVINVEKSFQKMKDFGAFNDYYLVFDEIKPKVSLENNKDKIIVKGHKNKKSVSLIVEKNDNVKNYLISQNIKANILVYEEGYQNSTLEPINGESNKTKFSNLESLLNKDKVNQNICLINSLNKDLCTKERKYLVKESIFLNANNLVEIKNNIESGSIILIKETATIDDVNLLIKQINYQDLKIVPLSELIKETK